MIDVISKSIVSAWLWSISWGWYHLPINTILLILLLFFVARLSIIRTVFCSLFFTFGAFLLLTVFGLLLGIWGIDVAYSPEDWGPVFDAAQVTFYVGFLYTVLQLLLYLLVHKLTNGRVPILLFISNMATAALVIQLLPKNVL